MNPNPPIASADSFVPFADVCKRMLGVHMMESRVVSSDLGPVRFVNMRPDGQVWIANESGVAIVSQSTLKICPPRHLMPAAAPAAAVAVARPAVAPPVGISQALTAAQTAAVADLRNMQAAVRPAGAGAVMASAPAPKPTSPPPADEPSAAPVKPAKSAPGSRLVRPVPRGYSTRAEHTAALQAAQAHALAIRQKQAQAAAVGITLVTSRASALVHADRARR